MQPIRQFFLAFLQNRSGNFGLLFALIIPVVIGCVGIAYDYSRLVNQRSALQVGLDTASLSAVSALAAKDKTVDNVRAYAISFLTSQLTGQLPDDQVAALVNSTTLTATKNTVGTKTTYTVSMSARVTETLTPFSALLGHRTANVAARSTTSSEVTRTALSFYLVVDRSGSMSWVTSTALSTPTYCQNYRNTTDWSYYPSLRSTSPCYLNKIAALKQAAGNLFDSIDSIENDDSSDKITRTGTVSFTDSQQTPSDLAWGTSDARAYISSLPAYPTGGTDMSTAMDTAYKALTATSEATAQAAQGNAQVQKYIVLMTDGENTGASSNHNTALDTKTLTACTAAKNAGVTIYTVAFMAPTLGKDLLLSCSGSSTNSYSAENADELISAFDAIGKKISDRATKLTN